MCITDGSIEGGQVTCFGASIFISHSQETLCITFTIEGLLIIAISKELLSSKECLVGLLVVGNNIELMYQQDTYHHHQNGTDAIAQWLDILLYKRLGNFNSLVKFIGLNLNVLFRHNNILFLLIAFKAMQN